MFTIWSKLTTDYPGASAVYYLAVERDVKRQGWIRMGTKTALDILGCGLVTLRRRCRKAVAIGLLHRFELRGGHLFVQYASVNKLDELTGGCFASTPGTIEDLQSIKGLKLKAYKAPFGAQQSREEWRIQKKKPKYILELSPEKPKGPQESRRRSLGCEAADFENHVYHAKENRHTYGAAQETIALNLERSKATVQRWAARIPHAKIWQRIPFKLFTLGYCKIFVDLKGKRQTRKRYIRRSNHYFLDIPTKRAPKKYERILKQHPIEINNSLKAVRRKKETFLEKLQNMSSDKVRRLADAILIHFCGRTNPEIKNLSIGQVMENIVRAENFLKPEQWTFVKEFLYERTAKGKNPIPPRLPQGQILTKRKGRSFYRKTEIKQCILRNLKQIKRDCFWLRPVKRIWQTLTLIQMKTGWLKF